MRIAVVHSYYSSAQPSGENVAVDSQVDLLRRAGHQVTLFAQRTDDRQHARRYPAVAGLTVATGRGRNPSDELTGLRPDVVHVHNLFPNWGTRWLAEWQGPVVATLHNFRALCAAGTLFRDGHVCTLCPDGEPKAALTHRCYHDSVLQTLPLAWRNRHGAPRDAVIARADRLVVLAERARDLYARYGVPTQRMTLLPNCVDDLPDAAPDATNDDTLADRWVFAGRLSPEKGLLELLDSWPADQQLDVVGDGPLADDVRRKLPPGGRLLGAVPRAELRASLPSYRGLVFPSRWPESATPLVVLEALAAGLPVVALRGNTAADLIAARKCGLVVADDDGWTRSLIAATTDRGTLATSARATYDELFAPDAWLRGITAVYEQAVTDAAAS